MVTEHVKNRGGWISTPLLALGAALWTSSAAGADLVVAQGEPSWDNGSKVYETVVIAGELGVRPYDQVDSETGWLHLRAHQITIEATGVVNATGAGFPAAPAGGKGYANDTGAGQTPPLTQLPAPAGGGAHVGTGGDGTTNSGCALFPNAAGGTAYDDGANPLALNPSDRFGGFGSAGGSGHNQAGDHTNQGGRGGGIIILEAARVVLDGTLEANGQGAATNTSGSGVLGAAPGGGAGGSVIIIANDFSYGATAQVSASGGAGTIDLNPPTVISGSGAGGRITLRIGTEHDAFGAQLAVAGGPGAGDCSGSTDPPAGQSGLAEIVAAPGCLDADGDGYDNELCGGDDCNDGDDGIHPDQTEVCNLRDDNCSGEIDEDPPAGSYICPQGAGYECNAEGQCVPSADGGASPPPAEPQAVEFGGGLCSASKGQAPGDRSGALLLGALLAATLLRHRRQRARGR